MCFVWIWEQTAIISLYSINWLVCMYNRDGVCLLRGTGCLYIIQISGTTSLTFTSSTFCQHSVFMCFVWIWEQTAIISLYSINWLVCMYNRDGVCLLRGTRCLYIIQISGYYMYHQFNIQQFYVLPTQCIYVFCVDLRTNRDYFPIHH